MKTNRGKFIVIEGMDGAGKTTILKMLEKYLVKNKKQNNFVFTREPGSSFSKEAEKIRSLILENGNEFSPMVDALLFATSRRINLEKGIWPSLEAGKNVISDRYWTSSYVYQGILGGIGVPKVKMINEIATDNTHPDFIIFFDLAPEISLKRLKDSRESMDRLEHLDVAYYQNLREAYLKVIAKDTKKFSVLDANCSIDELFEKFINLLVDQKIL
ncbi:dTMP kinase [Mycoplasma phocoeninasale]|uniref:Thymidylate kinase n=1 Tax=Mycoplasma phocoeninasale TaxID=2726117 RepID=A0A858U256_9MOLU|nr:dTMP kinase [Mycoplasma phocoeninasale]MBN0970888.1 dTMP kinase [Mycoplasma phocoeninasale]QJG66550.1 dTMP kinase [Mycoplasma phocoeninasale]